MTKNPKILTQPSYQSGFATAATRSAAPHMWKQLVGAWVPALGRQGRKIIDQSLFQNPGIAMGDPRWTVNRQGHALELSRNLDQHISIPHRPAYNLPGSFTILVFYDLRSLPSSTLDGESLISKGWDGYSGSWHIELNQTGDFLRFLGSGTDLRSANDLITVGPHCSGAVCNQTTFELYHDNQWVNSAPYIPVGENSSDVYIGKLANVDLGGRIINGSISAAYLWERALSPAELTAIYYDPLLPFRTRKTRPSFNLKMVPSRYQKIFLEPYLHPESLPTISQNANDPILGSVNISGGNFAVQNNTGLFSQLLEKYICLNRKVKIKCGHTSSPYETYDLRGTFVISGYKVHRDKISFTVKNSLSALFEEIPRQIFDRNDTIEFAGIPYGRTYPNDLLGTPKPLAWGEFGNSTTPNDREYWRLAAPLKLIREDKDFDNFSSNYSTSSIPANQLSASAPSYNMEILLFATNIKMGENSSTLQAAVRSLTITIDFGNSGYLAVEDGFYNGYYLKVLNEDKQAKISSFSYNASNNEAIFYLDCNDPTEYIDIDTDFACLLYCPVYHFFVCNHPIIEDMGILVDLGDGKGLREWISFNSTDEAATSYTRKLLPIPGYDSHTVVKMLFKSKDRNGGGDSAVGLLRNHADIVYDILSNPDVLSAPIDSAMIDLPSFSYSASQDSNKMAVFLDKPTKAIEVLRRIRTSTMSKLLISPKGTLKYLVRAPIADQVDPQTDISLSEVIGDVIYDVGVEDIYFGFIIRYALDWSENEFLEVRYDNQETKYLFKTTKTKVLETYLTDLIDATNLAQRYSFLYRAMRQRIYFTLPHNYCQDQTFDSTIQNYGEFIAFTNPRAPGPESALGDLFGEYKKAYELVGVTNATGKIKITGEANPNLNINAGFWANDQATEPYGFWADENGCDISGSENTRNTSLWV